MKVVVTGRPYRLADAVEVVEVEVDAVVAEVVAVVAEADAVVAEVVADAVLCL